MIAVATVAWTMTSLAVRLAARSITTRLGALRAELTKEQTR